MPKTPHRLNAVAYRNWRKPNHNSCGKFSADGHSVSSSMLWANICVVNFWRRFDIGRRRRSFVRHSNRMPVPAAANQKAGQSIFLYPFSLLRRFVFFFLHFSFRSLLLGQKSSRRHRPYKMVAQAIIIINLAAPIVIRFGRIFHRQYYLFFLLPFVRDEFCIEI